MIKIGILGFGAIGRLIFTSLSNCNNMYLSFIDERPYTKNTISFNYINIKNNQNKLVTAPKCTEINDLDLVILTTKTYNTATALESIKNKISKNIPITIVQNGMGNDLIVRNIVPNPYVLCSTNCGAYRDKDKLICTHIGSIIYDASQKFIDIKDFKASFIPWIPDNNINHKLFGKLAINAVINPITAIYDIKNGEIITHKEECEKIINEIFQISKREGYSYSFEELQQLIYSTAESTKFNYSSMHQDLKHNNKTEIDSIVGYLINLAKHHNISVPTLKLIYNRICIITNK